MFTGLVADIGRVVRVTPRAGEVELVIDAGRELLVELRAGDSIAVAGVCLTATRREAQSFAADVSAETLSRTTLGTLKDGSRVNLELALKVGAALGGHYVSGHVDGRAELLARHEENRSLRLTFAAPAPLACYLAPKGSVTLAGVSLTINEVEGARFGVNLIPLTRELTTLGALAIGEHANLEVDMIARYIERLLAAGAPLAPGA